MFSDVNDKSSHLIGMTDTSLKFVFKEGASGFPTVLCMLNRFLIDKTINGWYSNSGVQEETSIKLDDDLHWFKQMNMLDNFKESVIDGILKYSSFFDKSDDNTFIKDISFAFTTKNRKYFLIDNKLYSIDFMSGVNSLDDLHIESKYFTYIEGYLSLDEIEELKEQAKIFNEKIIGALSIGSIDYILTENNLYSRTSSDNATLKVVFSKNGIKTMCSDYSSFIVVVGSFGGMKINVDSSGNSTSSIPIKYKASTTQSEDSSSEQTTESTDNNLPENNNFTFCNIYEGSLFIGNSSKYGKFALSDSAFDKSQDTSEYEFSGSSTEFCNVNCSKTKSGIILNGLTVNASFDPICIEKDKNLYILYGTTGILFVSLDGRNSLNTNIVDTKFAINLNNKKYIKTTDGSLYSESEKNKLRLYTFNLDFDKESGMDKIDVGSFRLSIMDILNLENVYNEKIKVLNDRNITYAVGISSVGDKNEFYLFGNDERGKVAQEMRQCMDAFDMKA